MMPQTRSMSASMQMYDQRVRTPSYLQLPFAEQNAYLNNTNFLLVQQSMRNAGFSKTDYQVACENAKNQRELALGIHKHSVQLGLPRHNYGQSRM